MYVYVYMWRPKGSSDCLLFLRLFFPIKQQSFFVSHAHIKTRKTIKTIKTENITHKHNMTLIVSS